MKIPTYNKHISFKEVSALFIAKYPKGSIWKKTQDFTGKTKFYVYAVCFSKQGKVYTYKPYNNTNFIIMLDLSVDIKNDYDKYLVKLRNYENQPIPKHDTKFGLW